MRIILLGPPGAGKGTQAAVLAERLGIPHVASGDLFRDNIARGTELGRKAKSFLDNGQLVPDDVTIGMILDRLDQPDCQRGVVLDGFPRTLEQAQALSEALSSRGQRVHAAIYVRVSEDELVARLSGRRICKRCQAPYHVRSAPPRQEGICDRCGGELEQREDDQPEVIRKRLEVYAAQTAPLVDYYRRQGILHEANGEQSIEQVTQDILAALGIKV